MGTTGKLPVILSLSAASMALLQSTLPSKGQSAETETDKADGALNGQITSKTDRLLLERPLQKDLLRLYAGHTSHSSHSSHTSGMGGGSSTYIIPTPAPAPVYPTYAPTPAPPVTRTVPAPARPVLLESNAPPVKTAESSGEVSRLSYLDSLKQEAAKGAADAQYALALYYVHGEGGCEKNIEKAKMLLELSSIQGNDEAKKRLEKLLADEKAPASK